LHPENTRVLKKKRLRDIILPYSKQAVITLLIIANQWCFLLLKGPANMIIKKFFCTLLAVILIISASACSRGSAPALNISGAEIPQDVYAYYLDSVISKPKEYSLPSSPDKKSVTEKAEELCKEYVAVNAMLSQLSLSLANSEKAATSVTVNGLWRLLAKHYEAIGVTKQVLNKLQTAKTARTTLLQYYFGENGVNEVGEEELKATLKQNYVSFRSINGYLTKTTEDGATVNLTDQEMQALKSKLSSLAVRITDGEDFEDVSELFAADQGISTGRTDFRLLKRDDTTYPEGFFEEVEKLTPEVPGIITLDKYIFLVVKRDILLSEEDYFNTRDDLLKAIKGGKIDEMIVSAAANLDVQRDERVINDVYDRILASRKD
jgi:hypothetical protein